VPGDFSRTNPITSRRQILTRDVLRWLQGRLSKDAFCLLGITMEDLYSDPSWNFVFGEASFRERVGVYSFARYDPAFYGRAKDDVITH
jgi:archaemetzincin